MIIQSRNFVKDMKPSGIEIECKTYKSLPGFNIYTIMDENIIMKNFNKADDITTHVITYVKEQLVSNVKYIVGLVDTIVPKTFDVHKLRAELPELLLEKIVKLVSSNTYYFLFDNLNKILVSEKISAQHLVADTYTYDNGVLIKIPNRYIVCAYKQYPYFKEYIESIEKDLKLIYIRMRDIYSYQYINDPNEIYIFTNRDCGASKTCYKKIINFEQLSRPGMLAAITKLANAKIPIIEYSTENQCYQNNSIYLPYQYNPAEINKLRKYYARIPKKYDVAFVGRTSKRRKTILNGLRAKGLTVLVVKDWYDARDRNIASCKVLLNIHCVKDYKVYESLRCDRWAFAQMPVISEKSIATQDLDVRKYDIVYFYLYTDLVNETYKLVHNLKQPSLDNIESVQKMRRDLFHNLIVKNKI